MNNNIDIKNRIIKRKDVKTRETIYVSEEKLKLFKAKCDKLDIKYNQAWRLLMEDFLDERTN